MTMTITIMTIARIATTIAIMTIAMITTKTTTMTIAIITTMKMITMTMTKTIMTVNDNQ